MGDQKKLAKSTTVLDEAETLRRHISDTVNEIHKLIELAPDEQTEESLRRLRRAYFELWETVIKKEIDRTTPQYEKAVESLKEAQQAAAEAKKDIQKVAGAIKKAVSAAKAVDKIVNLGLKYLG